MQNWRKISKIIQAKGENGNTGGNPLDAGCRHITFRIMFEKKIKIIWKFFLFFFNFFFKLWLSDLTDQINSMCHFMQHIFVSTKYLQNTIENLENAFRARTKRGVGLSFKDATAKFAIEGSSVKQNGFLDL